jgi:creatinine amidohydrolase
MPIITDLMSTDDAVRNARVAVLPIGSFEQHGNYLPLATDTIVASLIAERVAARYGLFCLAPVTFSCSHEHEGFAGTVSLTAQTLIAVVADIRASLERRGVSRLVMVNGHGGNYVLSNIAQEANVRRPTVGLFPGRDDMSAAREASGMTTTTSEDMHGGEWETSILLHAYPDLVRDGYLDSDHKSDTRPYLHLLGMAGYTESGIIGQPSLATAEKGERALASLVDSFGVLLRTLLDSDTGSA